MWHHVKGGSGFILMLSPIKGSAGPILNMLQRLNRKKDMFANGDALP